MSRRLLVLTLSPRHRNRYKRKSAETLKCVSNTIFRNQNLNSVAFCHIFFWMDHHFLFLLSSISNAVNISIWSPMIPLTNKKKHFFFTFYMNIKQSQFMSTHEDSMPFNWNIDISHIISHFICFHPILSRIIFIHILWGNHSSIFDRLPCWLFSSFVDALFASKLLALCHLWGDKENASNGARKTSKLKTFMAFYTNAHKIIRGKMKEIRRKRIASKINEKSIAKWITFTFQLTNLSATYGTE